MKLTIFCLVTAITSAAAYAGTTTPPAHAPSHPQAAKHSRNDYKTDFCKQTADVLFCDPGPVGRTASLINIIKGGAAGNGFFFWRCEYAFGTVTLTFPQVVAKPTDPVLCPASFPMKLELGEFK